MESVIQAFEKYAHQLPLELFVFAGSFLEEAISPIPSFVVLIPAGAAAHVQGIGWWYLPVLALFSASGRIIASSLLYFIANKSEEVLLGKGRRFFGVSHAQVAKFGERLQRGRRDWWALFLLNAVPVMPTSFLSLACGFIKVPFRTFVTATFIGTAINAVVYLSIGYAGLKAVSELSGLGLVFQVAAGLLLAALLVWWLARKRNKRKRSQSK